MAMDGATATRKNLASRAGVSVAVANTMSGADLEFLAQKNDAGGITAKSGADIFLEGAARPSITSMGEPSYAAAGSKATRIFGEGFTGATGVTFGGTAGTAFSVVSDKVIAVTTPAKSAGTYDVVVAHPAGNATLTNGAVFA